MESQIPSIPKRIGGVRTTIIWKTRVRRKEMQAETAPLFKAVKKAEPHTLKPIGRNARA